MIFEHLPTIPIEQDGLYATACGKVFWVERETTYYNAVPQFIVGRESLSWRESGNILCAFNSTEIEFSTSYRIVAFLSKVKLRDLPTGYEYVGGHPTFGDVSESSFWVGVSGIKVGQYTIEGIIEPSRMTPFEKEKIGAARILLKQTRSATPDLPKEDPEEYVDITDLFPDMYAREGIDEFKADDSNLGWRVQTKENCRVDAGLGYTIGKNYAKYQLRHRCKRKDLPKENVVSVVNTASQPIFNNAPTCPIDKEGGWYVTANGLVVELYPMANDGYMNRQDHHRPVGHVKHNLSLAESVWWCTNGDVYMDYEHNKNLCQPILRIVAKLVNFTQDLPEGFKFKGGHPHFTKIEHTDLAWVSIDCIKNQKIVLNKIMSPNSFVYGQDVNTLTVCNLIGTARIVVEKTESTKQEVVVNLVPTPVLKEEVTMVPVQEAPVAPTTKPQNPVMQIAKATGNLAVRGANYWLAQPTMIIGGYVVRSLRFIVASAVIGSVVGSISYPDTAKKFAASLIPKVEVKIEKPSILK